MVLIGLCVLKKCCSYFLCTPPKKKEKSRKFKDKDRQTINRKKGRISKTEKIENKIENFAENIRKMPAVSRFRNAASTHFQFFHNRSYLIYFRKKHELNQCDIQHCRSEINAEGQGIKCLQKDSKHKQVCLTVLQVFIVKHYFYFEGNFY